MNTPEKTAHDPERRRYPRLRAKVPVELKYPEKTIMRTATDEISLGGCYIETMFTMDVGTKLELVFSLNEERVVAKGVVVTKYPQVGNGIDFFEMAPTDRLKLTQYMADCELKADL
jgi:c-di-GMP-binding flagellar brake protein YcgR